MKDIKEHPPGTFCWVELATTDGEGAKNFYTQLFGWDFSDQPVGPDAVYTMLKLSDQDVGALYQMSREQKSRGVPPHWNSYISVANADEIAHEVKALGGTVLAEPFDVFDAGRMAQCQDPAGATFAVWQPNLHMGVGILNEPGALCWHELATNDTKKATEFYTKLFGWGKKVSDIEGMTYTEFLHGERPAGGMLEISKEWGDVPPNWMVYFAVDDCDTAVDKITSLGGQIKVPPKDIPNVGRFATAQDSQGAYFSVIKLDNPE
ncbi:VOC family protein [candidate division KSB1 bacterium]|nr:VOC family protein [candidate division KSB1 bacterium]NIR72341.1 VOC family protein [candidate division KSB1 bacterium]NIS25047.1 VOC family protein [candidate division KSB1 bacterium]NIT71968.1 VOC family protein [candidate division KSB1 bacterium]NIU25724.1 VOC family protein [candidate division KSB1 bacterium]